MVAELKLDGIESSLIIEVAINELGWSRCYLSDGERIYLGADTIRVVVTGLLKAIDDPESKVEVNYIGKLQGHQVRFVLMLAEAHHALYVADEEPEWILFWQNKHQTPVELVGQTKLTLLQREQWRSQLMSLAGELKNTPLWW